MSDPSTPTTPRPMWKLAAAAVAAGWDCHITRHGPARIQLTLELRGDRWDPAPQHIATATWTWSNTGWRLEHATWDDRPGAPWASGPVQVRLRDLHKLAVKGPSDA